MAWHVLTALGDAMWRTEAGVALPGGGTATTYVDRLSLELEALELDWKGTSASTRARILIRRSGAPEWSRTARSVQSLHSRHVPRSNPDDGMGLLAGTPNQDEEVRSLGHSVGL